MDRRRDYWKKRVLYAKQKELNNSADFEDAMRYRLKSLQNEIIKEARKYITRYAETNNVSIEKATKILATIDSSKFDMTLEEFKAKAKAGGYEKELDSAYFKTRIARLKQLYAQYEKLASKYADKEEDQLGFELAKQYNETYLLQHYNRYRVVGSYGINLAHFNEQQIKDIVYQPWQGGNFSKRIWNNYTKVLPEVLTDRLLRATLMGYSPYEMEKEMRGAFQGVTDKQLHRLVVTEMGHAAEQATDQFYKDSNIDKYQYLATLESHTCDTCRSLDGKIFPVKKAVAGENYPLIHPYCRCTTMPYIEDLPPLQTRWYRNPVTGKGGWIDNMTFKQWQKANGVKPFSKSKFLAAKKPQKKLNGGQR